MTAILVGGCDDGDRGTESFIECNPVGSYDLTVVELEARDGGGCGPVDGAEAVTVAFDLRLSDFANWDDCEGTLRALESDTNPNQCAIEWNFTCFFSDGSEMRTGRASYVNPSVFEGEEVYSTSDSTLGRCESRYAVTMTRIGG